MLRTLILSGLVTGLIGTMSWYIVSWLVPLIHVLP